MEDPPRRERDARVVGEVLRAFRMRARLSASAAAARLDRDTEYVRELETGLRTPDLLELWEICRALGYELQEVVARLDDELHGTD